RMLAKEPQDRPASAREVAGTIADIEAGRHTGGRGASPRRLAFALAALAVTVVAAVVLFLLLKSRQPVVEDPTARHSPLDDGARQAAPAALLAWAGRGAPAEAPAELLGVLGDPRLRVPDDPHFQAVSHDGKLLAVGSGNDILLFDAATGSYLRNFVGHT